MLEHDMDDEAVNGCVPCFSLFLFTMRVYDSKPLRYLIAFGFVRLSHYSWAWLDLLENRVFFSGVVSAWRLPLLDQI